MKLEAGTVTQLLLARRSIKIPPQTDRKIFILCHSLEMYIYIFSWLRLRANVCHFSTPFYRYIYIYTHSQTTLHGNCISPRERERAEVWRSYYIAWNKRPRVYLGGCVFICEASISRAAQLCVRRCRWNKSRRRRRRRRFVIHGTREMKNCVRSRDIFCIRITYVHRTELWYVLLLYKLSWHLRFTHYYYYYATSSVVYET